MPQMAQTDPVGHRVATSRAPHPSNAREPRQQTLNFEFEMPQMAQTDPVGHRANAFAMFVRFAPGTNGDRQTEFCLTGYHGFRRDITLHSLCARVVVSATGNFASWEKSEDRRPKEGRIPKSDRSFGIESSVFGCFIPLRFLRSLM
jgi:hypothetical protein